MMDEGGEGQTRLEEDEEKRGRSEKNVEVLRRMVEAGEDR